MIRRFVRLPILMMVVISALLAACFGPMENDISCEDFQQNPTTSETFELEVGKEFLVTLGSNAAAGGRWSYVIAIPSVVGQVNHEFLVPDESTSASGYDGTEVWSFEGLSEGKTEISFNNSYRKDEWSFSIIVDVGDYGFFW